MVSFGWSTHAPCRAHPHGSAGMYYKKIDRSDIFWLVHSRGMQSAQGPAGSNVHRLYTGCTQAMYTGTGHVQCTQAQALRRRYDDPMRSFACFMLVLCRAHGGLQACTTRRSTPMRSSTSSS
eukprot:scaffold209447_cov23-Tisochrysis_lutea.AAC.1